MSGLVPHDLQPIYVETNSNYSDVLTKNTKETTFVTHSESILSGDIQCYLEEDEQEVNVSETTREDVGLDSSSSGVLRLTKRSDGWVTVEKRSKKSKQPKSLSWKDLNKNGKRG